VKKTVIFLFIALLLVVTIYRWHSHQRNAVPVVSEGSTPVSRSVEEATGSDEAAMATHTSAMNNAASPPSVSPDAKPHWTTPNTALTPTPQTLTDQFVEKYQKANIDQILRQSSSLTEFGAMNASVLATRDAFSIQTIEGEVHIFSSFGTEALAGETGCASIKNQSGNAIIGSLSDRTARLLQLPDQDAFGVMLLNTHLLVFYGNVATWGHQSPDAEPRVLMYYKRNAEHWSYQGQGTSKSNSLAVSGNQPDLSHEEFCQLINSTR
jgi:hypothetical protein